jgi:hypothetical protein
MAGKDGVGEVEGGQATGDNGGGNERDTVGGWFQGSPDPERAWEMGC